MPVPSNAPTDAELIAAAKAGDSSAYGVLVGRYQRAAVRIAAMALGSATDADDIAQEAFVKAHQALPRFRPGAPFKPWLFRIVVNTARSHQRRLGRQRSLALRSARLSAAVVSDPGDEVVQSADRAMLIEAINRLRPDDRLILTYRWYDELSEAEIATSLGCRAGTVKSRLHRAMARLRAEVTES